jgi:hypothetical protein
MCAVENRDRRLPDFVVIGAQKCGTTTLRNALREHPAVHCAPETHFFCDHFANGLDWYEEQLAVPDGNPQRVGEKCPHYLVHADALGRMAETIPEAQLVVVLRDPVTRAYSHYWHQRRVQKETLSFDDALDAETGGTRAGSDEGYVARGHYLPQLLRVCELYPRAALHVMIFEDLIHDPQPAFAELCAFLGVPEVPFVRHEAARANAYREYKPLWLHNAMFRHRLWRWLPKPAARALFHAMEHEVPYQPMNDAQRGRLEALFKEEKVDLGAWLGRELPWPG